jgi:putative intracellular protease/amidase
MSRNSLYWWVTRHRCRVDSHIGCFLVVRRVCTAAGHLASSPSQPFAGARIPAEAREIGHLLAELRSGRFTGEPFEVVSVAETLEPITTTGGLRVLPDALVEDLDPADSDLLILPGANLWDLGGGAPFAAAARRFLDAGVPVAAICGATLGLAAAGLLDERAHTSAAPEYLASSGYGGGEHYVDARAVIGGDLITAGPDSPVQFARATLERLGLMSGDVADAYEALFHRSDASAFPVLMAAAQA